MPSRTHFELLLNLLESYVLGSDIRPENMIEIRKIFNHCRTCLDKPEQLEQGLEKLQKYISNLST